MKKRIINLNSYIISLDKNISEFKEYSILKPEIVTGINGKTLRSDLIDLRYFNNNLLPKSVIGCALSHIKCWKKHKLKSNNYSLILEDDFFIKDKSLLNNLDKIIKFYISQAPKDFDILYLGSISGNLIRNCFNILNKVNDFKIINSYIYRPVISLGLHSYILSDSGIIKLLNNIENNKITFHLDYYIQTLSSKNVINTYITNPRIFYQTSTYNLNISQNISNIKCPFFNEYFIDEYVSLNYLLNVSLFTFHEININLWIIFLFVINLFIVFKIIKKYKK